MIKDKRLVFPSLIYPLIAVFCFTAEISAYERIISLSPGVTEILFEIGASSKTVGVSSYCDYPPETAKKQKVGDFSNPNLEKILELKPDLVFIAGFEQEFFIDRLKKYGIRVERVEPVSMQDLIAAVRLIGDLSGQSISSGKLIDRMNKEIELFKKDRSSKPKVFIEISLFPLMTVSEKTYINDIIEIAGGANTGRNLIRPYCQVSEEFVVMANPDVIVATTKGARQYFESRKYYKKIAAIKNNRIIDDIDPNMLLRPGPRVIDAIGELRRRIKGD